eukprot:TRINITY_DN1650_c0_g1_i1.p1 TRINITY_DN1650_c0_g1~~TRINITY_DN1650_c0_g1_i1.p1  ORF type:complete len:470 (-),score=148.88 TRINITY_DN1650_c0_g1_i1:101-1510(-)
MSVNNRKSKDVEEPASIERKSSLVQVTTPDGKIEETEIGEGNEEISKENRQGLLKVLGKAVGFDITAIALPVTVNEPASFLMRLCEQMQYSELLDKAAQAEDSIERLTYIAVFACTLYTVAERMGKPFNPLLGETFEYLNNERSGFKFVAEQVSHHPPIAACYAEADGWKFWEAQRLKTKFTGNSLDCSVEGSNNVLIKATNEHFKWVAVKTCVHNIIVGRMWIDHYGEFEVVNKSTGEKAKIRMKECGWFSKGWHEVNGEIYDAQGKECIILHGKWNEAIYAKANPKYAATLAASADKEEGEDSDSSPGGKSKKDAKKEKKKADLARKKVQKEMKKQLRKKLTSDEPIWTHNIKLLPNLDDPKNKYLVDWTQATLDMTVMDAEMKRHLPPTDSRLRADRAALQEADTKTAAAEKHAIEEKQREERRKREKEGKEWTPRWFKAGKDEDQQDVWEFTNTYWTERENRLAQ